MKKLMLVCLIVLSMAVATGCCCDNNSGSGTGPVDPITPPIPG